ncbi:MAG: GAF domain-containing protein [Chloroflexota bacterium]
MRRVRLGILVLMAALTTVTLVVYLVLAIQWRTIPFLGVTVNHTMTVNSSTSGSGEVWTGKAAGLRTGDHILSINAVSVSAPGRAEGGRTYTTVLSDYSAGDVVTVTFSYDPQIYPEDREPGVACEPGTGAQQICAVEVELMDLPDADFVGFFVAPYIAGVIVVMISWALIYLKPYDTNVFIAVAGLLPLALAMGGIFDVGSSHQLIPLWLSSGVLLGAMLITLGILFPSPIPPILFRPWARFIPFGIGLGLVVYVVSQYRVETPMPLPISNQVGVVSAIVGLAILAALMVFYHRRHATTILQRDQANVIFMGVMLGLAPAALWLGGRLLPGTSIFLLNIEATLPFLITPAISVAYSVLQYNTFDTDRVLSQGITYTILLVALMIGYFLMVLGASLFTTDIIDADNPLLIVVTIFFVSLLFVPLRTGLQRRIDSIYFRTRRDYQSRLETFSQKLTSLAGPTVMIEEFRTLLSETISPANIFIFLRNVQTGNYAAFGNPQPETDIVFSPDSGTIQLLKEKEAAIYLQPGVRWPKKLVLDRPRLHILKTIFLASLAGSETLNGFVSIGPPRSRSTNYRFEELRFVNNLVGQLAIAIERATVIQSLERSVKELEVLSQVSQAVNFTIEVGDLLELISAQTLKLIQSSYFYIVLHDVPANQLYYAFFLENEERYENLENRKWPIGKDLYSEVIQNSQPLRVDDYRETMARRGYEIVHENPNTRAWMAVSLIAGGRTLGAMVVGEAKPETHFTAEQLKIFGDIAALAASSLDKARLFTEANTRARQLAVLNDISRQLVATEGDVERLLDLIVTSAVDILNAEAGSLLLTVQDESGDLEFKVAVGGTGQELIGKRLDANYGLVGRVAQTGQPVISNDTTTDESWEGEVTDSGFRTRSVLAVPLIAKDNVIGVLEVINKKDGSFYVEEDVELLTTFAGQAAVAFENARLFQQTDLQLSQRVRELEALERIDRELNRNLDLYNVAEITVRWAVSNSNATAGLLGIPDEDNRYLHIIAKQGYDVEDHPENAEDNRWPMTTGIVSRVTRTRRPDLQPYVDMDPDYVPSLRSSLSQITVPMIAGDEISAILILETNREPRLNLLDQDWVQRLAEHASIAIENAKLYEELTRANRTKSEFMGFAAHELKNPLTSVKGYAATLGSSMAASLQAEQIQSFAAIIQNNADRMENIISDLRDIAASDANMLKIQVEPISMRQIVMDTIMSLQRQIDTKNQTVLNNITEDLPLVMADPKRMIQIMVNFISNANKYSPQDATITLDAEVRQNYVNRRGQQVGPMLHIKVRDTGIGMNEVDLSRIFKEDYFRSENELARAEKGTGLGMMITKRLIEGHNGEVWVESTLGEGSTFHFTVPIAPETQDEKTETAEAEGASD